MQESTVMATFTVQRIVYGRFSISLTTKIALAALLFHALLTLVYLSTVLLFKENITTFWSTAPDLLVLAINSLQAPVLKGSSISTENSQLWRELVSVREVDAGDQLSLIVGDRTNYLRRVGGVPQPGMLYE